jgi:CBS domain-containing protein
MAMILLHIERGLNELRKQDFPPIDAPLPEMPKSPLSRWRGLPITSFMIAPEKLVCVRKDLSLAEAFNIVENASYRFRHLLITETGKAGSPLLGIVSLRDMLKQIYGGIVSDISTVCVEDFMTIFTTVSQPDPMFVTIRQSDNLETAIEKFMQRISRGPATGRFYYMSAIPVVDDNDNAVSILSFKDILNLASKGILPFGEANVGEYYRPYSKIVTMTGDKRPIDARLQLGKTGQRDVPIVNKDAELLGLVPDHILLQNLATHDTLGEIMVPVTSLKLQTLGTSLSRMLEEYLPNNIAATYYSFVVIDDKKKPKPNLLGMIGYRDLFRAILAND